MGDFQHGTTNGYVNKRCRCDECRKAVSDFARARRAALKQGKPQRCQVCSSSKPLVWDHDHKTVSHRGWLCRDCNTLIGMFQDDPQLIQNAISYLGAYRE